MMVYLLQNPGFDFPFSCCKLKNETKFDAESLKQEDVADWPECKKEFEKQSTYKQLHKDVSVFLTFVSPANLNSIVSKACLECECFHYNSSISLVHFIHTR